MTISMTSSVEDRLGMLEAQMSFLVEEAQERRALRQSFAELSGDLTPVARQGLDSVSRALTELEGRGYADFARSGLGVVDRVVTSFSADDVEALGDNVVLILETIKEMTQPEVMQMMRSTLHDVSDVEIQDPPPSTWALLRRMRDPEVRRGLARLLAVLHSLGEADREVSRERKEHLT